ncbi:uncharacterized protein B0T15DRAFT_520527 [Chaetomium strumarium]|uniref:Uncharacterized protein n=1 Tax=Chaetomium strumarium TaxID=1170767 RepID=A0AAJ0H403_9PEZI|nr:hypothetical protein B0T15DRAFT_520527 [Chaetomium strumarium]
MDSIPPPATHDTAMTDAPAFHTARQQPPIQQVQTPPAAPSPTPTPQIPAAAATAPPSTSRAASTHPEPAVGGSGMPSASAITPGFAMPSEAAAHGAPVRQYINSKITGVLLEGMKLVAREQPKDPLRVLGEFLLQRSRELEGTGRADIS